MSKLSDYETYIISGLAQGANIKELKKVLRNFGQKPDSVSSIEKKLKELKKKYECKTTFQLVYDLSRYVIEIDIEEILK
ncbi:hypothetical protein ACH3PA_01165 [Leeuwenhoekiella sp. A2]|uniref:hypothetical protein n=1 Tax=Leeuwenhoekiella sp. A2 TaxID=3141460 RepID=UPI003A803203